MTVGRNSPYIFTKDVPYFLYFEILNKRYRAKSRRMLSALNRQVSSQNKTSERANVDKLFSRGVDDGLTSEDHHELMELKQHIALRDQRYFLILFICLLSTLTKCLSFTIQ